MKVLKSLWYWPIGLLLWVLYFFCTLEDRNLAMEKKLGGPYTSRIEHGLFTYTVYYTKTPKREPRKFLSWAEFKEMHITSKIKGY